MSALARALDARFELAQRSAREAGALQRLHYERGVQIETKSSEIDLVTQVDKACEALVIGAIQRAFPDDAILAEEGGGSDRAGAEFRWILDPLDGTTNFAHGYPRFCVSIGVEYNGERALATVFDPLLGELFCARRGEGATLNGRRLRVSHESEFGRSMLATGFAYDIRKTADDNLDHFAAVVKRARAVRRDGSAALDLCYVAAGRFDGFWELGLKAWDVAAGLLLVEEAGGRTSDLDGGPAPREGLRTVASNGRIHAALLATLARRR